MFRSTTRSVSTGPRVRLTAAAAVGALALFTNAGSATQAVASTSTAASVEAETFALPSSAGQVFVDPSAAGGAALLIWSAATATATVSTGAVSAITVRARGDQCAGAPLLTLRVDGTAVGTVAVAATSWTDEVFTGSWAPGSHQIAVSYPNDFVGGGCDRNLRLDRVSFTTAPAPAPVGVEAELMALPAAAGGPFTDPTASAGAGLLIWSDATASTTLSAPAGGQLVVRARGDACAGPAHLSVAIDGRVTSTAAAAATWGDVTAPGAWPGGAHQVQVAFIDDHQGSGCDRNLRLDRLTVQPTTPTTPTAGHLFGLSSAGPDQGISTAQTTAAGLGRHLDVINFYQAWVWDTPLPVTELRAVAAGGAEPEITWEPWDPRQGTDQPGYSLAAISAGTHDAYITSWAQAAAGYGKPLMIRWGHEMNGTWYPWAPAVNGGSPAAYIAAYRHVHDLFRAAGATNVSWVWSPNVVQGQPTPLAQLYPGPGYVDVIGIDGYNGGSDVSSMGGWRTPQEVFASTLAVVGQLAPTTPVVVNETGSSEHGGNKGAWIAQLFDYLATATRVSGLFWFDYAIPGQADWRLTTSPAALAAAGAALRGW